MKRIAILGSTGSIGRQTLDVVRHSGNFKVVSLTANTNKELLLKQAREFSVEYYSTVQEQGAACLTEALKKNIDLAVIACSGISAIDAVLYAIEQNIDVAIANKEILCCCGEVITAKLKNSKSAFMPIDSEHSAIWQCAGKQKRAIEKVYLTASGGSFYNCSYEELKQVTPKQAERHPKWQMGADITLDCNTLFNKNLEVLEAKWLFDIDVSQVQIVRHPQSIVHSFVQFTDGSIMAQLSHPDMRLPISYAVNYSERTHSDLQRLDLQQLNGLTFEKPDTDKFPCCSLFYNDKYNRGLSPTVAIAANNAARELFRKGKIRFDEIYDVIVQALDHFDLCNEKVTPSKVQEIYGNVINYTYSLFGE